MASKQSFGLKCGEGITIVVPYVKAVTLPEKRRFQKGIGTLKVLPNPGLILNLKTKDLVFLTVLYNPGPQQWIQIEGCKLYNLYKSVHNLEKF